MYIDFHTHLDFYKDENALFEQLANFGGIIVSSSVDEKSYKKNIQIQKKCDSLGCSTKIISTFGIHPSKVPYAPKNLKVFDELCTGSCMIGEIGMDFCWYKDASEAEQERVFRYFLQHCNEEKKYCVIHTKDAEEKICRILEEYSCAKPIIHWYDGDKEIYKEFIKRGYIQTFGCETCRSKHIQELLRLTPLSLLLAETDNPDSEIWLGGSDNSVGLIKKVYRDIADVLKISVEKLCNIIEENSTKIFNSF
ncbi:TatD family hydrolase [Treponema pectinovorum]|uniref:TatD family hydrolase n=1 Tax=Treponema pectinovorum TaxID=164 RepID=UPI0011C8F45F|nr:TatD family hydrolase [Treponema pectinovorum]